MQKFKIEQSGTTFAIANFPWAKDYPATPHTEVTVSYDDAGFRFRFVSYETHLRAVETAHNTAVHKDSCMEVFMQFTPATDERYINIEINPNGAAYSAVSYCRERSQQINPADIDTLGIKTSVYDDRWEIVLTVSKEYIQKQIPSYRHGKGSILRGNFYKCGDETDHPHFGCFHNIVWEQPDFHRPEFFAEFELI
ncbi:MAG: hypothetical protein IJW55_02815 [Clostridia bacterium]|nr:hypothetical protein [Clostridia bacterium]